MLGAIIGDIVGSRFEFNNTLTENFELFTDECSYTDDTICTTAIADALLSIRVDYKASIVNWCKCFPNPKGCYGGRFAQWLSSPVKMPYYSLGNGSAMRVSPVAFYFNNLDIIRQQAAATAEFTHNHPEGIKGAVTIATCIYILRTTKNVSIAKNMVREYAEGLYRDIPHYRFHSNPFDETCMNAVPVAIGCFLDSNSFEDAIRKAVAVGGDSDTIGAIAGSLAEACYGIPEDIKKRALEYLPNSIKRVVECFYHNIENFARLNANTEDD